MTLALDAMDLPGALRMDRFVVAGWSLGGMAAQLVASDFPDRAIHVVLIGTTPTISLSAKARAVLIESAYRIDSDPDEDIALYFDPASAWSRTRALHIHERIAARTRDPNAVVTASLAEKLLVDSDAPQVPRDAKEWGRMRETHQPWQRMNWPPVAQRSRNRRNLDADGRPAATPARCRQRDLRGP